MKLRTSPALRIRNADEQGVIVEQVISGAVYEIEPVTASLLRILTEPEDQQLLTSDFGIPRDVVEELLANELLIEDALGTMDTLVENASPTFAETPHRSPAKIAFIGFPMDAMSVTGPGAALGPAAIRLASAFPQYELDNTNTALGWYDASRGRQVLRGVEMTDLGDVHVEIGDSVESVGCRLRNSVWICRSLAMLPVIFGGDHSLSWWALQGFQRESLSVLHIDAHTDNAMPPLCGLPSNASVLRALGSLEHVKTIVTAGLRGFLPLAQEGVNPSHRLLSMTEVRRLGVERIVELLPPDMPCYVTLDIDALDPTLAPATNVPVPGGFTLEEIELLLEAVGSARALAGFDVVELNGSRDTHLATARVIAHLTRTLLAAAFA